MNQEQIIQMALDSGMAPFKHSVTVAHVADLERFYEMSAAAERQRLHDKFMEIHKSQQHSNNYWHFAARKIKEQE